MKLAIIGGLDATGHKCIRQILHHGYEVSMLVAGKAPVSNHPGLTIRAGSPENEPALTKAMHGAHAVVVMPDVAYTPQLIQNVITCMYGYNLRRLIITTNLEQAQGAAPELGIAAMLRQTSLDWTIIHTTSIKTLQGQLAAHNNMAVTAKDFAKFMVEQITDVAHLQTSVMLTN